MVTEAENSVDKSKARSNNLSKNMRLSAVAKFAGFGLNYLSIPLAISYVSTEEYGLWLTFNSIFLWLGLLDVSFGNGLRNELVKALSIGEDSLARRQVSTLYMFIIAFMAGLVMISVPLLQVFSWNSVFNSHISEENIRLSLLLLIVSFAGQTILKSIHAILLADQKAGWVSSITLVINALVLVCIVVARYILPGSLLVLCTIMGSMPVLVYLIINIWLFASRYKFCAPSVKEVDFKAGSAILSSGGKFFVIQITALLMFSSGNIAVSYFEGASSVAAYGISQRYFNVVILLFGTITTPYWSAFTQALIQDDKNWIRNSLSRLSTYAFGMTLFSIILLIVSPWVYSLWLGTKVIIPFYLSALMAVYTMTYVFLNVYNSFINGSGKIYLQMRVASLGIIVYLPLLYMFVKVFGLGVSGVILVSIIWNIFTCLLWRKQSSLLLNGKATGIWNK